MHACVRACVRAYLRVCVCVYTSVNPVCLITTAHTGSVVAMTDTWWQVGSDQIAEDDAMFPNTMCSSPDDAKSPRKHARMAGLSHVSVLGVYAVLDQGLPQTLLAPQRRGYFCFSGGGSGEGVGGGREMGVKGIAFTWF